MSKKKDSFITQWLQNWKDKKGRQVLYGVTDRTNDLWLLKLEDFLIDHSRVTAKEREVFYNSLHLLVRSGVRFTRAVALLGNRTSNPRFKRVLNTTVYDMENQGLSFSLAMSKYPQVFSASESKIIYAGEIAGKLEESLGSISKQLQKNLEITRRVKGALMYPLTVFVAIVIAAIVVMTFVVPRFAVLFSEFSAELPLSTRILIGSSDIVLSYWWLLIGGGVMLVMLFQSWRRSPEGRQTWDQFLLKMPLFGGMIRNLQTVRIALNLSALLESGVPITKALHILAEIIQNHIIRNALFQVEHDVLGGKELSHSFQEKDVFDSILGEVTEIGEKGGNIPEILEKTGEQYEAELDMQLKNLSTTMEPLIIVVIGGVVVFMAVAIMTPIFQLQEIFTAA